MIISRSLWSVIWISSTSAWSCAGIEVSEALCPGKVECLTSLVAAPGSDGKTQVWESRELRVAVFGAPEKG